MNTQIIVLGILAIVWIISVFGMAKVMSKKQERELRIDAIKEFANTNGIASMQEIPNLFLDQKLQAKEIVILSMDLAKQFNLIPMGSVLRNVWYAFFKLVYAKNGIAFKTSGSSRLSSDLFAWIKENRIHYLDYNIVNNSGNVLLQYSKGFGNTILNLEKNSAFNSFTNLASLLGLTLISQGGQPSASGSEYIFNNLYDKKDIDIRSVVDCDPAGYVINDSVKNHFDYFTSFDPNHSIINCSMIAPKFEHYTHEELLQGLYDCSGKTKVIWNTQEAIDYREEFGIPDGKGLEVESLPADPNQIFDQLFPDYNCSNNWNNNSRLRLLILYDLMESYGINGFFINRLDNTFENDENSSVLVKEASGMDLLSEVVIEINQTLETLECQLDRKLADDKQKVFDELDSWKDETIKSESENEEKVHDFTQLVINKVIENEENLWLSEFEIPQEIIDNIEISDEKKENINRIKEILQGVLAELKEVLDPDDDGDYTNDDEEDGLFEIDDDNNEEDEDGLVEIDDDNNEEDNFIEKEIKNFICKICEEEIDNSDLDDNSLTYRKQEGSIKYIYHYDCAYVNDLIPNCPYCYDEIKTIEEEFKFKDEGEDEEKSYHRECAVKKGFLPKCLHCYKEITKDQITFVNIIDSLYHRDCAIETNDLKEEDKLCPYCHKVISKWDDLFKDVFGDGTEYHLECAEEIAKSKNKK